MTSISANARRHNDVLSLPYVDYCPCDGCPMDLFCGMYETACEAFFWYIRAGDNKAKKVMAEGKTNPTAAIYARAMRDQ